MSRKALGITAAIALIALISVVAVAQSRRIAQPALDQINLALLEGRYDQVADLARGLDNQDPTVAALVARAAIARGRYQDAENLLTPIAQRAPTSEAALELGLLLNTLGRPEATALLTRVAGLVEVSNNPRELLRGARALRVLPGRAMEANAAFRDAAGAAPRDADIQAFWGELFLEKFNKAEAQKSFQDALRLNPRWVPALIGSAQALADENPPQAMQLAKKALEINPSSVPAHVFMAGEAVDAGRRDEARASLQKALAVNPSSLEAHALLAALAYVEDKLPEYESEIAKVLAIAPRYGEVYRAVGELASHNFRYDDAAAITRKGMALDPGNALILSDMGIHLLRTGDEPEARRVLEDSFKLDDYNQVTFNLLQMMDTLDKFVTQTDGDVIIKMDKGEAPVLGEYAMPLAKQALDTLSKRYQFTPKGPITIEIFPKHDDFAVRTAGLPGLIGALGVCFGRVVTLDSPHARPGEFQWEATLWHELAHVITLQMSNHRIPRWLTEGISVYEETLQRPEWGRTMDMEFASLMNRGEIIKLRNLNAAFTDPRTISLGYFQASLLVDHIVKTYGDDGLRKLVRAFAEGVDTEGAFKAAFNTDFDRMQSGFDATLEKKYGTLRAALAPPPQGTDLSKMPIEMLRAYANEHPDSFPAQMFLAEAAQKAGNSDEAVKALERAAVLAPMATGEDSPHQLLAEIALQKKDIPTAIANLKKAMTADFDNIGVPRKLADLMRESGVKDPAELLPVYRRIVAIDPFDPEAHATLGRLAMQANQPDVAVREFKVVVALNPVDQAAAFTDLAESYFKSGKRADARRQTLAALEIAPSYERAQNLLLQLAESRPVTRRAAVGLALALSFCLIPVLQPVVDAQLPAIADDRFAGLQWRFVRIKYHYVTEGTRIQQEFYGEPWLIDGPAAEQNLSRRLKTATSIDVQDPIVLTLDDPKLFMYPWIYFVEPGNLALTPSDAKTLREFLLRGGTALFDDFHETLRWNAAPTEIDKVFPEREIVDFPKDHPVFSCFYKLDGYPQVAGLGSFMSGRTWEKGGYVAHLRTIFDDNKRPMLYINWNTDMGDGWEWSNAEDYPGYIKYTSMAYRMGINEVVYALTH